MIVSEEVFKHAYERLHDMFYPATPIMVDARVVLSLAELCMDYLSQPDAYIADEVIMKMTQHKRLWLFKAALLHIPEFVMSTLESQGQVMRFRDPGTN